MRLLAHDTPIGPGDIVLWSDERPEAVHFGRGGVVQRVWTEEEVDAIGTTRSVTWIEATYQLESIEQHGLDDAANPHRTVTLRADGLFKHNTRVSLRGLARRCQPPWWMIPG